MGGSESVIQPGPCVSGRGASVLMCDSGEGSAARRLGEWCRNCGKLRRGTPVAKGRSGREGGSKSRIISTEQLSKARMKMIVKQWCSVGMVAALCWSMNRVEAGRSEEHTSELQSRLHLVCRLLLEKKKKK